MPSSRSSTSFGLLSSSCRNASSFMARTITCSWMEFCCTMCLFLILFLKVTRENALFAHNIRGGQKQSVLGTMRVEDKTRHERVTLHACVSRPSPDTSE